MKKDVTLFITDDHRLVLEGLATLIQSIDGFVLQGKFSSAKEMLAALGQTAVRPDVCLVDIEMPGMDGIEAVREIRHRFPDQRVMALTMHEESHFVNRMIAAGANGYVLKNVDRDVFEQSIRKVMKDSTFFTAGMESPTAPGDDALSLRERQVLRLIAMGKSNREIADELFISDRTADTHRTNIKKKVGLSSLSELIQYARERGYIS